MSSIAAHIGMRTAAFFVLCHFLALSVTAQESVIAPAVSDEAPAYPWLAEISQPAPESAEEQPSDEPPAATSSCQGNATGSCPCQKCCSKKKKEALQKAVAGAYKGLFYDNNFDYLCDPCYQGWFPGENLKRLGIGHCMTLDVGGQYRARQHSERNLRLLGLTGIDDDFLLHRARIYTNLEIGRRIRFYFEYLDAVSEFENFGPRPIEENRSDVQNLFLDAVLLSGGPGTLTGRAGRQELLYGAQRLVSPLDWANTRRTFDGGKFMWSGRKWNIDTFWTRPLKRDFRQFDSANLDQQFYGIYSTYKGFKKDIAEVYWLGLDNDVFGFRYDTIGGRYYGHCGDWLMELEAGYQFGTNANDSSHSAGAVTMGVGRKFKHAWNPALWVYYDFASGTNATGAGNGWHHNFPLAHKYLGFMDLFGRRNIETPNVQLTLQPHKRVKFLLWYYYFFLENKNDTPYSVTMTPFFGGVTPGSADLGHEIDTLFTFTVNPRMNIVFGYSRFFSGRYYNTPGLPFSGDADFFYTQYQWNF